MEHRLTDKLAALFKWPDLDFARHSVFAKRYSLSGEDSERLGALFDAELVSFFESRIRTPEKIGVPGIYYLREHPLPSVEAQGKGFVYQPKRLIAPDEVSAFVRDLENLLELLGARRLSDAKRASSPVRGTY